MAKRKKKEGLAGIADPTVDVSGETTPEVAATPAAPQEALPPTDRAPVALTPGTNEPMAVSPDVQVNVGGAVPQKVEPSDEDEINQFFDFDIDDIVRDDPEMQEVLKNLKADATTDMKPSRKLALAFTALADPKYAQAMVQQHGAKKERASQTLMGLGTKILGMRKEGQRQSMMQEREISKQAAAFDKQTAALVSKAEESDKKRRWLHNSKMVQERTKEMGEMRIPTNYLAPTDMEDDKAVQGYLLATTDEMTQGKKALDSIAFWEQTVGVEEMGDPNAAIDSFRLVATMHGNTPEEVEDMVEGYGPRIRAKATWAKQQFDKQQAKIDAEIARMDINVDEARMKTRSIEQAIKSGNMKDLRTQALVVKDMAGVYSQMQKDYATLVTQGEDLAWLEKQGEIDRPTYLGLREENTSLRQAALPRLTEFGRLVQHAQQRMQQFDRKLKGSENYQRIFDQTMQDTIMDNPELATDPLAATEMILNGPMEGPRQQFWGTMLGRLQAEYPKMSPQEISAFIDEDAAQQLIEMSQQPGMPATSVHDQAQPQGAAMPDHDMPTPQPIDPGGGAGLFGAAKEGLSAAFGLDPRSQTQKSNDE